MIAKSPLIYSITFRKPSVSPAYYRLIIEIIEPGGTRIRYVIKFPLTRHNCENWQLNLEQKQTDG